jgi:hypothetical protein
MTTQVRGRTCYFHFVRPHAEIYVTTIPPATQTQNCVVQ